MLRNTECKLFARDFWFRAENAEDAENTKSPSLIAREEGGGDELKLFLITFFKNYVEYGSNHWIGIVPQNKR